jgi:trimeric autotransporter adhesin
VGNDFLYGRETKDLLIGGNGLDLLVGGGGDDVIDGDGNVSSANSGWSTVINAYPNGSTYAYELIVNGAGYSSDGYSSGGEDVIYAGAGDDWASGGTADDDIYGGQGGDLLFGDAGDDFVDGGEGNDYIKGDSGTVPAEYQGADYLLGGAGNDYIWGNGGDDNIFGGVGSDYLEGGAENDTYWFNRGDGADVINNDATDYSTTVDKLEFGEGITIADLSLQRETNPEGFGKDLRIRLTGTDDSIILSRWDDMYGNSARYHIDLFSFADGTVLTETEFMQSLGGEVYGTAGNDRLEGVGEGGSQIYGFEGDDYLSASYMGNDTLDGGPGNDTLAGGTVCLFGIGSGIDEISGIDTVEFGAGITPDDLELSSFDIWGAESRLRINIKGTYDSLIGSADQYRFADGTVLSATELEARCRKSSGTDSTIKFEIGSGGFAVTQPVAGYGKLTIEFGAGITPDNINLVRNGDSLCVNLNDTADSLLIVNWFLGYAGAYQFRFNDGILLSGYEMEAKGYLLATAIDGSADGDLLVGGSGQDYLRGYGGTDTLDGGAGSDVLWGGDGDDIYRFGRGSGVDLINSGCADPAADFDKVEFGAGITPDDLELVKDGDFQIGIKGMSDVLIINNWAYLDQFSFADGTALSVAEFETRGITVFAPSSSGFYNDFYGAAGNDRIHGIGNGNDRLYGLDGNDTLYAGTYNDTLTGGRGDDTYVFERSSSGAHLIDNKADDYATATDTVAFGVGITPDDLELLRVGNSLQIRIRETSESLWLDWFSDNACRIKQFRFADGTVLSAAELEARGYGVFGTNGSDTYTIKRGSGATTIYNYSSYYASTTDTVAFGEGIFETDLALMKDGDDLRINIAGLTDSLIIHEWFTGNAFKVDQFQFADGMTLAASQMEAKGYTERTNTLYGTADNDILLGFNGRDTITGYDGNDKLYGYKDNDILNGGAGDDFLIGGLGADTMTGGTGNDIYVVDSVGDIVIENSGEGTDTVQSSIAYTLGDTLENLTLTGTDAVDCTGNDLDNKILGNSADNVLTSGTGDDILNGRGGMDTMIGGIGNDTYIIDDADAIVTENAGEGTDTVQSSISYALGDNLENLTLTGGDDIDATGNVFVNVLTGNRGANIIDGGAGADTMTGGAGDDIYIVDSAGDVVSENINEGADTVQSSITYTLGDNLENLTLTGEAAINGMGNLLDNEIAGNSAANVLDGGVGNDTVYGYGGDDIYLFGRGSGMDTINDFDATGGTDTILLGEGILPSDVSLSRNVYDVVLSISESTDSITIANWFDETGLYKVERMQFADGTVWDSSNMPPIANAPTEGDDSLVGTLGDDSIDGLDGNDQIYGAAGADDLRGGAGNDILYGEKDNDLLHGNEGNDTLYGGDGADDLVGGYGDDVLYGGDGKDWLQGDAGNNLFDGGTGDDEINITAWEVNGENTILVKRGGDFDHVVARLRQDHTYVDKIMFDTGITPEDITVQINPGSNFGGSDNPLLAIGIGNDEGLLIEGENQGGMRLMIGIGPGPGANLGLSDLPIRRFVFADGQELTLEDILARADGGIVGQQYGTGGDDLLRGSIASDYIVGNEGNDVIDAGGRDDSAYGGSGDDIIAGGRGDDYLRGNEGNDVFAFNRGDGHDSIDPYPGRYPGDIDTLSFGKNINLSDVSAFVNDYGTASILVSGSDDRIDIPWFEIVYDLDQQKYILEDNADRGISRVQFISADGTARVFDLAGIVLSLKDSLVAATVNNPVPVFTDATSAYELTGSVTPAGGDYGVNYALTGDLFIPPQENHAPVLVTPIVTHSATEDAAFAFTVPAGTFADVDAGDSLSYSATLSDGTALPSWLAFNAATMTFSGTPSHDDIGSLPLKLIATDSAGASVSDVFDLSVQSKYITGTNAGETITGTDCNDVISGLGGNDTLYGLIGNDTLKGGDGSDTLYGGDGNDTLVGGVKADTMYGGTGNDTYYVDDAGDVVTEAADEGTDRVYSSVSYTLGDNIENLVLVGGDAINGTGNDLDNDLQGNDRANVISGGAGNDHISTDGGDDILLGGAGNDTLIGGAGSDTYLCGRTDGKDTISDNSAEATDSDTVKLADGIGTTEPVIVKQNNDLYFFIDANNYIKAASQFMSSNYGVEHLEVTDGSYITRQDIENIVNTMSSINNNSGMDVIQKFNVMRNDQTYIATLAQSWHQIPN